jgi:8-oxo-dGTP diphosphatase
MCVKVRAGPDGMFACARRLRAQLPRAVAHPLGATRASAGCQHGGMDPQAAEVKASGGVVWRRARDTIEVVVVHRPRYDDWSLPKGKLDPDEGWEQAAVREVQEEVGLRCTLGEELPPVNYNDKKGRAKAVRYWLMEPEDDDAPFTPNDEVDEMRWLDVEAAAALLSYPRDAELVRLAGRRA